MAAIPTPGESEAAMLAGFRCETVELDGPPGPATQLAVCPRCTHSFEVPPPPATPVRVTE
jgi:hypothetical protein